MDRTQEAERQQKTYYTNHNWESTDRFIREALNRLEAHSPASAVPTIKLQKFGIDTGTRPPEMMWWDFAYRLRELAGNGHRQVMVEFAGYGDTPRYWIPKNGGLNGNAAKEPGPAA